MTSHIIHSSYMSETIVHNKEDMNAIEKYEKEDYKKNIKYCIIRDNLSPKKIPSHKYNYYCFLTDKQFYHIRYGYMPFLKSIPFSEDIHYMKSCLIMCMEKIFYYQKKIIKMNLEEFYDLLNKTEDNVNDNYVTLQAKKDYLEKYTRKWKNPKGLSLVEVGKKDDFIYQGLVLFDYLPEFFVKIY